MVVECVRHAGGVKVSEELQIIGIVGYELWKSHLVGNNCQKNQQRYDRMKEPIEGDLVLELYSTRLWAGTKPGDWHLPEHCIGYFVRQTRESIPGWDEGSASGISNL